MQARSPTNCKAPGSNSIQMNVASRAGFAALLIAFYAPISAKADNVDDYVSARMRQLHIPGLSLAIVRDGRVTKAQGYGFANLELSAHATKETVYEIGSNTKQFTAAAIMMLVRDGKLHLEDPITEYFPEAPQAWRNITIRRLLTHTSGIQNHVAVPHWLDIFKIDLGFETSPARDELLKMFFKFAS
jgi:CubicO group peptidase (beta-lactamase class C family)